MSLGAPSNSPTLQNAINAAHNAGSLVVAAMGNKRTEGNPTSYPAANDNVMAVAATTTTDTYAHYSQYGPHTDIAAPGGELYYLHDTHGIMSTLPTYNNFFLHTDPFYGGYNVGYDYLQGTSMATPYVAGLAALVWSMNPALTPDQVQQTIQDTAVDLGPAGWDPDYGWGRIDALAAVMAQAVPSTPTLLAITNPGGGGNYQVDWTDSTNASGYLLQEDDNASFASPAVRYSGPNSQASISGQGPGTWYYRVLATGAAGDSAWSNVEYVTVRPDPPTLAAISNAGQEDAYLVDWSASVAASGYVLEEDEDPAFGSPKTRYMGTSTQYQVTGQGDGTWHYRVHATNAAGSSAPSNVESTTVAPLPLDPPTLNPINNADGNGAYLVDWPGVLDATSYTLEQSATPYFEAPQEVYTGADPQFNVSDQPPGTWYYRARAWGDGLARGPWSEPGSVVVPAFIYLPIVIR
jgi:hypothetical protein